MIFHRCKGVVNKLLQIYTVGMQLYEKRRIQETGRAEGEKLGLEFMWIGEIHDLLPYGMEVNNQSSNFTALS